jgi:hypothetical protein
MTICLDCHEEIPEAIDEGRDQCTTCYIDMMERSLLDAKMEMERHKVLAESQHREMINIREYILTAREDLKRENRALAA